MVCDLISGIGSLTSAADGHLAHLVAECQVLSGSVNPPLRPRCGKVIKPGLGVVAEVLAGEEFEALAGLPGYTEGRVFQDADQRVHRFGRVEVAKGFGTGDSNVHVGVGVLEAGNERGDCRGVRDIAQRVGGFELQKRLVFSEGSEEEGRVSLGPAAVEGADAGGANGEIDAVAGFDIVAGDVDAATGELEIGKAEHPFALLVGRMRVHVHRGVLGIVVGEVVEEADNWPADEGVESDADGFERCFVERDDADVFAGDALRVDLDGVVIEPALDGPGAFGIGDTSSTGSKGGHESDPCGAMDFSH